MSAQRQIHSTIAVNVDDQPWISIEEVWKGCAIKFLHHDPKSGLLVALFKFEPGTQLPRHSHPSDGHGFILEGEYIVAGRNFGPRTYTFAPAGVEHGDDAEAGPNGYLAIGLYPHGSGIYERFLPERGTGAISPT